MILLTYSKQRLRYTLLCKRAYICIYIHKGLFLLVFSLYVLFLMLQALIYVFYRLLKLACGMRHILALLKIYKVCMSCCKRPECG